MEQKRKLFGRDVCAPDQDMVNTPATLRVVSRTKRVKPDGQPSQKLFIGNLPLVITASALKKELGVNVICVQWITDITSGGYYGSAYVWMRTVGHAKGVIERSRGVKGIRISGGDGSRPRLLRANFVSLKQGETVEGVRETERPPIGCPYT